MVGTSDLKRFIRLLFSRLVKINAIGSNIQKALFHFSVPSWSFSIYAYLVFSEWWGRRTTNTLVLWQKHSILALFSLYGQSCRNLAGLFDLEV